MLELFTDVSGIEYSGRLAGDFSPETAITKTLFLENGDSIYVPAFSNTIRISGQVNQQITTNFKNTLKLGDYIDLAGGFTGSADKKLIFIISATGEGKWCPKEDYSMRVIFFYNQEIRYLFQEISVSLIIFL